MLKNLIKGFLELVYPHNCPVCQTFILPSHSQEIICDACASLIERNHPPFCQKCSRPLGQKIHYPLCQECRLTKPYFDFAWSCLLYKDPLKNLIHQFKYKQKTCLAIAFSQWMLAFINAYHFDIKQFDLIIPVPLHTARLRERGYNQSYLLAHPIAKEFQIKISTTNIIRVRYTPPQVQLSQKERWTNIEGAFRIKSQNEINNKNILIIDDLLTTGATASEIARTLKKAGAKTVGVLTLSVTEEK
ncbi:MAG TPA: ComF family protein [Candidatus Omnitrophota bacterium]|nr:ComF family protein [Candidatus Omnitrophota bacterium]HPN88930.1 ComF family protein [Candidatus Omnitrophota bacterium]